MKLLPLLLALAVAAPAFAKDVCLTDAEGRHYRSRTSSCRRRRAR